MSKKKKKKKKKKRYSWQNGMSKYDFEHQNTIFLINFEIECQIGYF